jgi:hypothetical protein
MILVLLLAATVNTFAGKIPVHQFINDMTGIDVGTLTLGGCIRANYVKGEYPDDATGQTKRRGEKGSLELDVFRINVDWQKDSWLGKVEYRWYDGYSFFHTAWLGYDLDLNTQIQVGLNRVPFGVGAYGPANSWFFDQHYYVGLSDDMDMGVKVSRSYGNLKLDLAYYAAAEPNGVGSKDDQSWTEDSARYSYDIVDTGDANSHYSERNQFNARVIGSIFSNSIPTELGISLQAGQLVAGSSSTADDTIGYAISVHSSSTLGPWNLKLQLTDYDYRPDYNDPAQSDDLIQMGAYTYHDAVAASGVIPSAALSYTVTPEMAWIDSITFYNDISVIMKDGEDNAGNRLNDSTMNVTGVAVASGGWYIQFDYAYANGNYFVGGDGSYDDFGSNQTDDWEGRFNVNVGYYF